MKKITILFMTLLMLAAPLLAREVIILKNGKRMVVNGTYEVKGQYVVITEKNGELRQLPLRIVDLEKSKEASEAERQRLTELEKQAAATVKKPEQKSKYATMSEIAEYVEGSRTADNPAKSDVAIGNDGLDKFREANPIPVNTEAQFTYTPDEEFSADAFETNRQQYGQQYQDKKREIEALKERIAQQQAFADAMASQATLGDDATGGSYDAMERADKKVAQMQQDVKKLEKDLKRIEKEARNAGVRDVKRYKGKKDGSN